MAWTAVKAKPPNGLNGFMINHTALCSAGGKFYSFGGLLPEGPTMKVFVADPSAPLLSVR